MVAQLAPSEIVHTLVHQRDMRKRVVAILQRQEDSESGELGNNAHWRIKDASLKTFEKRDW